MKKNLLEEINKNVANCRDNNKRKIIKNIIQFNDWFVKMDINLFVSILYDIGYSKEQALKYYKIIVLNNKTY